LRKKSLKFRALLVSIVIHVVVLSCFAVVTFSRNEPESKSRGQVTAEVRSLNNFVSEKRIVKKPEFRSITESRDGGYTLEETGGTITESGNISNEESGDSEKQPVTSSAEKINTEFTESSVSFFNSTAYARKICYLVDCSGSMKGIFTGVQKRLKESINKLRQDQFFEVLFFNEDVTGFSDGTLVRASRNNVSKATRFVDIVNPSGTTRALKAVKAALRVKGTAGEPVELIYFLTDGFELSGEEASKFTRSVKELLGSAGGGVQINIIAFWPQSADKKALSEIAGSTGGEMVVIDQ
jgi:hypothetical protein